MADRQRSTEAIEADRARALGLGRRFWEFATKAGYDVQAPTERDVEHLGARVQDMLEQQRRAGGIVGRGQASYGAPMGRSGGGDVHNAGYEWKPRDHQGAPGPYIGVDVPLGGPFIGGVTIGPSDDDAVDTYLTVGLGSPGIHGGYTDDSKAGVEGLSGSIGVGGPVGGATVHGNIGSDGRMHGAGLESAGRRAGGGPHLGKPSLTYGVNVDEALQEFDRMVREFGSFVASEIGRRNDPEWYIGRRGMNR